MDGPLTGVAASVNSPLLQDPAGIPYWVITSQGGLGPRGPAEEPQKVYPGNTQDIFLIIQNIILYPQSHRFL